jgi:hypothetical protein
MFTRAVEIETKAGKGSDLSSTINEKVLPVLKDCRSSTGKKAAAIQEVPFVTVRPVLLLRSDWRSAGCRTRNTVVIRAGRPNLEPSPCLPTMQQR